jgi:hypothetical protein
MALEVFLNWFLVVRRDILSSLEIRMRYMNLLEFTG